MGVLFHSLKSFVRRSYNHPPVKAKVTLYYRNPLSLTEQKCTVIGVKSLNYLGGFQTANPNLLFGHTHKENSRVWPMVC